MITTMDAKMIAETEKWLDGIMNEFIQSGFFVMIDTKNETYLEDTVFSFEIRSRENTAQSETIFLHHSELYTALYMMRKMKTIANLVP